MRHLEVKTRVLMYHSSNLVNNCDLWSDSMNKPEIVDKE